MNEDIYALCCGADVVYVGRTARLGERVSAHRARGVVFDTIQILENVPADKSASAEGRWIAKYNPRLNRTGAGGGCHAGQRARSLMTEVIRFRATPAMRDQLRGYANRKGCDVSDIMREAVGAFFATHQ